jgi:hypothetical protein
VAVEFAAQGIVPGVSTKTLKDLVVALVKIKLTSNFARIRDSVWWLRVVRERQSKLVSNLGPKFTEHINLIS